MDGGRVLRALLGLRMDRVRATRTAATVGRVIAVGLGLLGLAGDAFLILIAVFVWVGAGAEARAVAEERGARRASPSAAPWSRGSPRWRRTRRSGARSISRSGARRRDFPVSDGRRLLGVLGHAALLRGLRDLGPEGRVADAMQPPRIADAQAPLGALLRAAPPGEDGLVCVLDRGRLAGIVDLGGVRDYLRGAAGADGRAPMIELLTAAQMARADAAAIALGTSGATLMEAAGRAVAEAAAALAPDGPLLVLAGPGDNGGDGYVAARLLANAGRAVTVMALGDPARPSRRRRDRARGLVRAGRRPRRRRCRRRR